MTRQPRSHGGGFLIAVGVIGGAVIGARHGEATIGFLAGLGAGIGAALLVWLVDVVRARRR